MAKSSSYSTPKVTSDQDAYLLSLCPRFVNSDSDSELVCFTFTQQSSYADFKLLFVVLQTEKKLLSLLTN